MKVYFRNEGNKYDCHDLDIKQIDNWAMNLNLDDYDKDATPEERTKRLQRYIDTEFNNPLRNNEDKENYHRGFVAVPKRKDDEELFEGDPMDTLVAPDPYKQFIAEEMDKYYVKRIKEIIKDEELSDIAISVGLDGVAIKDYALIHKMNLATAYNHYNKAMKLLGEDTKFIKELRENLENI